MSRTQYGGIVIAAFPASGKSYAATRSATVVDLDSSAFSWEWRGPETRVRHPDWPSNYLQRIEELITDEKIVLVSTHSAVRSLLEKARIPFTLVYPAPPLREEWRTRMAGRGSDDQLVARVIDELWNPALAGCASQAGCVHVVLRSGEYLTDVIGNV